MPVSSCIVDYKDISYFNFWKRSVDSKLVIVFAEGACNVIFAGRGFVFLSEHGYMVISPVNARPHQVCHTGVHPNIVFVGMLEMPNLGNQVAIGACDYTAAF